MYVIRRTEDARNGLLRQFRQQDEQVVLGARTAGHRRAISPRAPAIAMIACHLAQRHVDGLNGIGRIDDPTNVLRIRICGQTAHRLLLEEATEAEAKFSVYSRIRIKRVELGNLCCADLDQLRTEIIRAKERLRHKTEIIKSCSRQCGYLL